MGFSQTVRLIWTLTLACADCNEEAEAYSDGAVSEGLGFGVPATIPVR